MNSDTSIVNFSDLTCFLVIGILPLYNKSVFSRNGAAKPDTKPDGDTLEVVDEYKYLESMGTNDGRYFQEIICRLLQAHCAFQRKKGLLTSPEIKI